MVLNIDVAPSILDICGVARAAQGARPIVEAAAAESARHPGGRSWYYEYNYEKEFPYTPNVRGVRTDEWKYVHYPNGDGQPDTYRAELYNLKSDPLETKNLIDGAPDQREQLKTELARLQQETGALPDQMPLNPEMKMEMPAQNIR